ncbi:MAG TPA: molybdopterin-dependent oxidoreductase [Candidatus Binataceae bacterium]|nr:molybdopterin-dependent oxidoreductase [Candidatus Binataceae bacterium]
MGGLIKRRDFLTAATAATLLSACDGGLIRRFGKAALTRSNDAFEELIFSRQRLAPELPRSEETPEQDFPAYFKSASIPIAPANWILRVGGLVQRPMVFTLDQLMRMPVTDMRVRHYCVDGWTAAASWRGVRLREIANLVGIDPRDRFVEFRSFDAGYWSGWDLDSALHPQTLLAYGMNGHRLGAEHGAPLRLYSAVKLGYKNVKYLTDVNFLPTKVNGYWEDRGFDWFAGV